MNYAKPYIMGASPPLYCAWTLANPFPLAHPEMLYINAGLEAAMAFSLSSNFSQTRGTAKNIVGLAHTKVSTNVPCKASGLAKKT
jgi:hypothetical protein